jgi:hypothetical protein
LPLGLGISPWPASGPVGHVTNDCDAKIKQATAAKPAQLNREEIDEVAISSDKELE